MVILMIFLLIICSIVLFFHFVIGKANYNVNDSIIGKEAEEKYEDLYPNNSIINLKSEIETIARMFVNGEESNRYTELLKEKAEKDERIQEIKDSVLDNVELVKYVDSVLKARIKYKNDTYKYTLILSFSTVSNGRLFLDDYFVFKDNLVVDKAV